MRVVSSLLLVTLGSISLLALADDGKGYAGSACSATGASYSSGRLLNPNAATLNATCPFINDSITLDVVDDSPIVWFFDLSSTASVSCTAYERTQTSGSVSGYAAAGNYPSGSGSSTTYTNTAPTKMTFSGTLGSYDVRSQATWNYIYCTVPGTTATGQSGIAAYFIEENT